MNNFLDKKFMSYALNLARKNLGITAPNPVVGCVLVSDKKIISSGVTAKNGRPHAEKIAIEKVFNKSLLQGATAYVTLEPCAHFGQTSPCVDEIIKYKFARVVIATRDPDLRVNGNSIAKLKSAGIAVEVGVLEDEAREINRGFFSAKIRARPFVTLKIASSLDGKIATSSFDSKWITCEKSRQFGHILRAQNDAILIGAKTLRKDNPRLDCRIVGLEDFSPRIVILTRQNNFDEKLHIFQNQKNQPIILSDERGIDLRSALKKLCESGINNLLIEGGAEVATQFLQQNLIDELVWFRSVKIIGNDGIAAISNCGFEKISQVIANFERKESRNIDEDIVEILRRKVD